MNQRTSAGFAEESFGKVLSPVRLQRFLPVLGRVSMPRVEGGITSHQNGLEVLNDKMKLNR